jgi:cytochrome c-type biogenesis protein CcmE
MKTRQKRIWFVLLGLFSLSIGAALLLSAFKQSLVFFFTPSQIAANEAPLDRNLRIGGLVEKGSLTHEPENLTSRFLVTDTIHSIPVVYKGILPDLFKEGRGCVAQGKLVDGVFYADVVLAKHDENYMPPEAARSIEDSTKWANKAAKTVANK